MAIKVDIEVLKTLSPVSALSDSRLQELASLCYIESVSKNIDPFRMRGIAGQSVFLVRGELALVRGEGVQPEVVVGGSGEARYALGKRGAAFSSARAITDVDLIRVDDDLLDIMVTWDQLAEGGLSETGGAAQPAQASMANWSILSGMFSVNNLKFGAFSQLPAAHIDRRCSTRRAKQKAIRKRSPKGLLRNHASDSAASRSDNNAVLSGTLTELSGSARTSD